MSEEKAPVLIEARGLSFEAGGSRLLGPLDMTVRRGRRLVVLGPNGSGKSLLLRLLHGLIAPTDGQVIKHGRDSGTSNGLESEREAMVFQRPVMLRRSAAANVRYALSLRGVPWQDRATRAMAALERAGLTALAKRPARVLSGGEQQRLALARALSLEPEVLFLDEPTASLDPYSMSAIESLIADAHDGGTTIVMVTHDLGQARRLADEIVFLHRGRIVERATVEDFFRQPGSEAARSFLEGRIVH